MSSVQLSLATVDHHEVGYGFAFVDSSPKIARHNLTHRRKVIDAFDVAHFELSVLRPIRPTVLKPYRGRNGIRSLRVRDVEAHDRTGHALQSELPL